MKQHSKSFYNLFFSQLFANTGDIIYIIGIIAFIYEKTGKATNAAAIPIVITIGIFISGLISPYIYQYLSKKSVLYLFQSLKIIIMIFIFIGMYFSSSILIYLLVFLNSLFDGFTNPIKNSYIPFIEKEENILPANAKMNTMNNTVQVGSWALGGTLLALIGYAYLIVFTIVAYMISLIFILFIYDDKKTEKSKDRLFTSFIKMVQKNLHNQWSLFLNISTIIESFAHSVWIAAILLIYVESFLKVDTFWFGMINAIFFAGMIFSGAYVNSKNKYFSKHSKFFILYLPILTALVNFSFTVNKTLSLVLLFSFIYGVFDEIRSVVLHSKIQRELSNDEITETYIFNGMLYSFCFAVSTFLISKAVDEWGIIWAFVISGTAYVLVFLVGIKFKNIIAN